MCAQCVMTGRRTESRHTEHSSAEPLAKTNRSFSIRRSRSSAGVAAAPTDTIFDKSTCENDDRGKRCFCIEARAVATIEDIDVMCSFIWGNLGFYNDMKRSLQSRITGILRIWLGLHIHLTVFMLIQQGW